ncbi:MAG: binding-protein-dependent transport system inner rane component [Frondihabitans sp.]|nr:binding-protein-dependent transport system inner rane component [Frondihabitans sp.]
MIIAKRESIATHAILVLVAIFAVYPLASIIVQSLSANGTGHSEFDWSNYSVAWTQGDFASALRSSAVVALTVVLVTAFIASLAGFALGTMRVPGGRIVMGLLLLGVVLPYEVTLLPLYELLSRWGLTDSYLALILPQIGLSVPLGVFWMRSFFRSVPVELLEAARMDGATRLQSFRQILLPIAAPAIATLCTILFLFTWNEFLLALVLVPTNTAVQTAPLALSFFSGAQHSANLSVTAAAAVLVAAPVVIAYVFLQRRLISGIVDGAVK